ncbi:MAG: HD domain-containing protein [Bacteroidales bacterium]|jgi:class 3 adenylate cyclase/predicted metal-dependent HD superfamily phosphohydrolase|nr:HD domain-containing protein [Bacteroidales bacterium]
MAAHSKQQLLKRIATLISENKELREKYRLLSESYQQTMEELDQYKQTKHSNDTASGQVRFNMATLLFVDIKGFSNIMSNALNVERQMDKLDHYLLRFSDILQKYRLVKIQSIGDNLIYAGGILEKNITNPVTVTLAALEMLHVMETEGENDTWCVNIGIHTGAVTASAAEKKHTVFRIKGDTINIVSRIVSLGGKNTVTISATTYELVKELFDCVYTGIIPVKYQDHLELFRVNGIRPQFAADTAHRLPNDVFRTRFLLYRFGDLQEQVLDLLEKKLPKYLYYHNVKHTVDVVTESELIGWAEGLDDHRLLLLKTAALFHDTGHIVSYADHEERSTDIAREMLLEHGYVPEEINEICRIIMATKLPPKPADLLESIICDADLDYLGRTDFIPVSNSLYEELKTQNKMSSLNEWNKMQLKFINSHQYFTATGRKLREVKKQEQITRIKQLILPE